MTSQDFPGGAEQSIDVLVSVTMPGRPDHLAVLLQQAEQLGWQVTLAGVEVEPVNADPVITDLSPRVAAEGQTRPQTIWVHEEDIFISMGVFRDRSGERADSTLPARAFYSLLRYRRDLFIRGKDCDHDWLELNDEAPGDEPLLSVRRTHTALGDDSLLGAINFGPGSNRVAARVVNAFIQKQ